MSSADHRIAPILVKKCIAGSNWIPRKYANPAGSICEVRAGGKKIHRTTLMREKWIFGSIYERAGLAE